MKTHATGVGILRCMAAFIGILAVAPSLDASSYSILDLQNVPVAPGSTFTGTSSKASFINNSGWVTGYQYSGLAYQAFLYNGSVETNLGNFNSATLPQSYPAGLNASGQVSGFSYDSSNVAQTFLYNGTLNDLAATTAYSVGGLNDYGRVAGSILSGGGTHAAILTLSNVTDIGTLGGSQGTAIAINDSGNIAGNSKLSGDAFNEAFFSTNGASLTPITLGGHNSTATAMNASGQVAGYSYLSNNTVYSAFLYNPATSTTTDLDTISGTVNSQAVAIDDSGQVAGNIWVGGNSHAFFYDNGKMQDLGTLGGLTSTATAINDLGWVVGNSTTALGATDAFVWIYNSSTDSGTMYDLNTWNPTGSPFSTLQYANGINDVGAIIGQGLVGGSSHAYELYATAIGPSAPEPSTLSAVGIALAAAIFGIRRRARRIAQ